MCSEGTRACPSTQSLACECVRTLRYRYDWLEVCPVRAILIFLCTLPVAAWAAALELDFLKDTPVMHLTDADKKMQRDAAMFVLDQEQPNASREWHNPMTGYSGRIEGQGDLISDDGLQCRKLKIVVNAKGGESVFVLPLCKDARGEWFFGSGMKLKPKAERGSSVAERDTVIYRI